eukprot:jgi/Bigna1/75507/fgenesh1_pg.35_\
MSSSRSAPRKTEEHYVEYLFQIGGTIFVHHTIKGAKYHVDSKYDGLYKLGEGAYGLVVAGREKGTKKIAIKKIGKFAEDLLDGMRILREIKLLLHLKHINIIGLKDIFGDYRKLDDIYLVFDRMETNMHDIIYSKNKLTEEHVKYFIWQLLCGMKYMHSAGIIHRDLKPSNLLLNSDCDMKICDFGLARGELGDTEFKEYTEYVVTRWYRAPEVMLSPGKYNRKMDVWSIGCIMAELIGRRPIFRGDNYIEQMKLIFKQLGTPLMRIWISSQTNRTASHHHQALKYVKTKMGHMKKVPWSETFPNASEDAIDLLSKVRVLVEFSLILDSVLRRRLDYSVWFIDDLQVHTSDTPISHQMLHFHPKHRISVEDALNHPYLAKVRIEEYEKIADKKLDMEFEDIHLSKENLQLYDDDCVIDFVAGLHSSRNFVLNVWSLATIDEYPIKNVCASFPPLEPQAKIWEEICYFRPEWKSLKVPFKYTSKEESEKESA